MREKLIFSYTNPYRVESPIEVKDGRKRRRERRARERRVA
jgi:hypothetical protein